MCLDMDQTLNKRAIRPKKCPSSFLKADYKEVKVIIIDVLQLIFLDFTTISTYTSSSLILTIYPSFPSHVQSGSVLHTFSRWNAFVIFSLHKRFMRMCTSLVNPFPPLFTSSLTFDLIYFPQVSHFFCLSSLSLSISLYI